jgi:hypothetical protein
LILSDHVAKNFGSVSVRFQLCDDITHLRRSDTQNVKRSEQGHTLGRALPTKLDPGRRVIAGVVFASNIAIHAVYRNDSAAS